MRHFVWQSAFLEEKTEEEKRRKKIKREEEKRKERNLWMELRLPIT